MPDQKVEDGINAAHLMFKRVWFDEAKCAPSLEALRQHRVDYDEKTRAFKKTARASTSHTVFSASLELDYHAYGGEQQQPYS